jgi:hypothetical protein
MNKQLYATHMMHRHRSFVDSASELQSAHLQLQITYWLIHRPLPKSWSALVHVDPTKRRSTMLISIPILTTWAIARNRAAMEKTRKKSNFAAITWHVQRARVSDKPYIVCASIVLQGMTWTSLNVRTRILILRVWNIPGDFPSYITFAANEWRRTRKETTMAILRCARMRRSCIYTDLWIYRRLCTAMRTRMVATNSFE